MGLTKMGNTVPRAGIEPTSLAFCASVLTILPCTPFWCHHLPAYLPMHLLASEVSTDYYNSFTIAMVLKLWLCIKLSPKGFKMNKLWSTAFHHNNCVGLKKYYGCFSFVNVPLNSIVALEITHKSLSSFMSSINQDRDYLLANSPWQSMVNGFSASMHDDFYLP